MFENEVRDYEEVRDQLKALLAKDPEFVGQLIKYIRQYNSVTKALRDKVYEESKSTGKAVYAGPFGAKTGTKTDYDFDAIEDLVPLVEFSQVVDVKYTLKKGAASKMTSLASEFPKLKAHIHEVPGNTLTNGPKVIEGVDELEALG